MAIWTSIRAWPTYSTHKRLTVIVIAASWLGYTIVNMFWPGGQFFYVLPHACALALIIQGLYEFWPKTDKTARRQWFGALFCLGVALAAWNIHAGLLPQSRLENNPGYKRAMWIGEHTEPASWIIISGLGFSNSKVYLPNFAHRTREVLEYYFDRRPKEEALRKITEFTGRLARYGIPMYMLSDLIESPTVAADMKRLWNVEIPEIQQAFGPGRVVRVAATNDERVYLFVPQVHQSELFVVLGYSILNETSPERINEHVVALKEIVREMTPLERREAARMMREKNWGFDLLREGFAPYMNANSQAAAEERYQNFVRYQGSPDFWLRAGNLYLILGLKPETIDAWSKAQKMSGDASLLKDIAALKKQI
jgi:hypothetical protein